MTSPPRLHVEVRGDGDALVFAHGFGGSARNFRPQLRTFGEHYRVVTYDHRGHARSEAPTDPGAYRLAELAHDLARVLDDAGVERAIVGGLSLGAATALELAATRPQRVRALVLASVPGPGGFAKVASAFADAIDRDGLEAAGARFVWGPDSGLDERGAALVKQGFLEHPPHAVASFLRGAIPELARPRHEDPRLAGLPIPTLLISGERDHAAVEAADRLTGVLPNARHVVIPDAGHVVNLVKPAEFDTAVRTFLEELP